MSDHPGSVAFDRAAEYYDRTRTLSDAATAAVTGLLVAELRGRGRVLEPGVGTGRIALSLHEAGIPMAGIDLSEPMLRRLLEKAGARPPFPVALADVTLLPFASDSFGGAVISHVFHLVPAWETAVDEIARVLGPGALALVNLGRYSGVHREIQQHLAHEAGVDLRPVGLGWDDWHLLDRAFAGHGAAVRSLPPVPERSTESLEEFVAGLEGNCYSWTWPLADDVRMRAAAATRNWAQDRFGPLDAPFESQFEILWRAYDLPG